MEVDNWARFPAIKPIIIAGKAINKAKIIFELSMDFLFTGRLNKSQLLRFSRAIKGYTNLAVSVMKR